MASNEELELQIALLKRSNQRALDNIMFLEAEVIALGNILINSKIITIEELSKMTDAVLQKHAAERVKEKEMSPFHLTKEELEDELSKLRPQDR